MCTGTTKVAVTGVGGRMGGRILSLLLKDASIRIVGATERDGHNYFGVDIGRIIGISDVNIVVTDDITVAASEADAIIDFTTPRATLRNAEFASSTGKPMVIGTTGFTEEERRELERLTRGFPCVFSPNMSIGINVVFEIARKLAEYLGRDFDIEIVEAHHGEKIDSPSGTAIKLGEIIADATGRDFTKVARFERYGQLGQRTKDEIGIQSIRGGDIVGDHTVLFCGIGERVELTHSASSRDNFAKGAIRALKWIVGKPSGIYSMKDVLGF